MNAIEQYHAKVMDLLDKIVSTQSENIDRAANVIIDTQKAGRRVWVIGPGVHSFIGVEEMCYRSGGIFNIYPMQCNMLSLGGGQAWTATMMERTPGLALSIFKASGVEDGDAIIVYNQYGINPVAIESALVAKAMGLKSIGITSSEFCKAIEDGHPARHPSNLDLCDVVDVHVNTWMPAGDALVELEGMDGPAVACSTMVGVFTMNLVVSRTVEIAQAKYPEIKLTRCGNTPGGDEYNLKNMQELGDELGYGGAKGRNQTYPEQSKVLAIAQGMRG